MERVPEPDHDGPRRDAETPDNRPFAGPVDRRHLQEGDHSSLDRCAVARAVLDAYPGLWGALVFSDGAVLTYPPIPGWRRPPPSERYSHDGAGLLRRLGELAEAGAPVDGL